MWTVLGSKTRSHSLSVVTMVLILNGISEIGAHVRSSLLHLIRSRTVTNRIVFFEKTFFNSSEIRLRMEFFFLIAKLLLRTVSESKYVSKGVVK